MTNDRVAVLAMAPGGDDRPGDRWVGVRGPAMRGAPVRELAAVMRVTRLVVDTAVTPAVVVSEALDPAVRDRAVMTVVMVGVGVPIVRSAHLSRYVMTGRRSLMTSVPRILIVMLVRRYRDCRRSCKIGSHAIW